MTVGLDEFRADLADLNLAMTDDLSAFWAANADLPDAEFRALMLDAYPEIVTPHISLAGDLTADWYDAQNPASAYRAAPAGLPPVEQLQTSAAWALSQEQSLPLLAGSAQRMLFGGSRDTVLSNSAAEGTRWARHASANACRFCQMLATRNDQYLYTSEKAANSSKGKSGTKYHDHCHCIAVPVRSGQEYTPPDYVGKWEEDYKAAKELAGSSSDTAAIMRAYRLI